MDTVLVTLVHNIREALKEAVRQRDELHELRTTLHAMANKAMVAETRAALLEDLLHDYIHGDATLVQNPDGTVVRQGLPRDHPED